MTPEQVYATSGVAALALTALGMWLSNRATRAASARQAAIDQGPYVESLQGWSRDIVAWWQRRVEEITAEHRAELAQLREQAAAELARCEQRAAYWKRRATAQGAENDTPPERDL